MSITKLALKFAAPLPDIESYDRYLFFGPHPDDIEIGAGATAAKLAAAGKQICFVICTDGRYGGGYVPDLKPLELAVKRKQEALDSAHLLGIHDVRFMNFSDGGFYKYKAFKQEIAKVIGDFRPDVIFAPDPDVSSECHIDHLNTGNAVKQIGMFAPFAGIMKKYDAECADVKAIALYMTAKPNRYVSTGKYMYLQDRAVFQCHKTQFPEGASETGSIRAYWKLRAIDFGIRSLKGQAEGFRVLGPTQMHCLPEAGL